jgi:hypothetical protein
VPCLARLILYRIIKEVHRSGDGGRVVLGNEDTDIFGVAIGRT